MNESVFNAYSKYYDLLYLDKDYVGEAKYVEKQLINNGIDKGDILEFGSGTGKHGRLLAEKGYNVHGIELSQEMIDLADTNERFTCQQGDICNTKLDKKFDSVISLFHVMSYQVSNKNLESVFLNASHHLDPGGIFLFDFWYTPAVYNFNPSVRVKRMKDDMTEITRIAEPDIHVNENRVDVNYTIYSENLENGEINSFKESHEMRHFSLPEIDVLANISGFTRVSANEFLTAQAPSQNTWGVCVVLKKI